MCTGSLRRQENNEKEPASTVVSPHESVVNPHSTRAPAGETEMEERQGEVRNSFNQGAMEYATTPHFRSRCLG